MAMRGESAVSIPSQLLPRGYFPFASLLAITGMHQKIEHVPIG